MSAFWASPLTVTALLLVLGYSLRQAGRERRHRALLRRLNARLEEFQVRPVHAPADDLERPLMERILRPLWRGWEDAVARRVLPARVEAELARHLRMAGYHWSPEAFVAVRLLVSLAVTVLAALFVLAAAPGLPGWQSWGLVAGFGLLTYLLFGAHVRSRAQARRQQLEQELPEIFDLLSVSVEAGLSFEAALRRVTLRLKGVAGEEFGRVESDLSVGLSRNEALRALAARTESRLLLRFANLMAQSGRTGAGVGPALRALARDVKEERIARVREQAAQLPVKLLFPMIVFILPTLFALVLGPGIYSILKSLGGG